MRELAQIRQELDEIDREMMALSRQEQEKLLREANHA